MFIGNISFKSTKESISSVFEHIPSFKEVRLITDREKGTLKGYGYAEFMDAQGVEAALKLGGANVDGRSLNINPAENKRSGPREGGFQGGSGFKGRPDPADQASKKGFVQKFQGEMEYL